MPKFEILCVTMHQTDFAKVEEMNIHSNVVFANQCNRTAYTLCQSHTVSGETDAIKIRDELLPFALFESVRVGADYDCFLSEALRKKSKDLKEFLGTFTAVTITHNPFTCGLIREKSRDLYEVDYFTADVENGEITDIKG